MKKLFILAGLFLVGASVSLSAHALLLKPLHEVNLGKSLVRGFLVSPDSRYLALDQSSWVDVISLGTFQRERRIRNEGLGSYLPFDFSTHQNLIVAETATSHLSLFNLVTGKIEFQNNPFGYELEVLRLHPFKPLLVQAKYDRLKVINYALNEEVLEVPVRCDYFTSCGVEFLPNSDDLLLKSEDKVQLSIFNLKTKKKRSLPVAYSNFLQFIQDLKVKPLGHELALSLKESPVVTLFNTDSATQTWKYAHSDWVSSLAWHPYEPYLVSADWEGELKINHTQINQTVKTLKKPVGVVRVQFSFDGRRLIVVLVNGVIEQLEFPSGKLLSSFDIGKPILDARLTPDESKWIFQLWPSVKHGDKIFGIYESGLKKLTYHGPMKPLQIQALGEFPEWNDFRKKLLEELRLNQSMSLSELKCLEGEFELGTENFDQLFCRFQSCNLKVKKELIDVPWNSQDPNGLVSNYAKAMQKTGERVEKVMGESSPMCPGF